MIIPEFSLRPAGLIAAALLSAACASHPTPTSSSQIQARLPDTARPAGLSAQTAPERSQADRLSVRAVQTGLASWYGEPFHGRLTASGEVFDKNALTAAHPDWPLRSLARVTRVQTGRSVLVRINDRGPYVDGRIIDLSRAAAEQLGFLDDGLTEVRVESLGPADPADRAARSRILPQE